MSKTPQNKHNIIEELRKDRKQGLAYIVNLKDEANNLNRALAVIIKELGRLRVANNNIFLVLDMWQERLED